MDLQHSISVDGIEVIQGVEMVVHRGHKYVVDVEEQAAVRSFDNVVDELPLGHGGGFKADVAGEVLENERDLKFVLNSFDFIADVFNVGFGVGHGQQVVMVCASALGPTEVVGNPRTFRFLL